MVTSDPPFKPGDRVVSDQPKFPIGTRVVWNGGYTHNVKYMDYTHEPFEVRSHWHSRDGAAAYPGAAASPGNGYWETDLQLAEGPW